MKENTVNYPDLANCFQRHLHRSRRVVLSTSTWVSGTHHTLNTILALASNDGYGAASVHTTSRICAAGNSWIERSNQYTSIIWFSFAAVASVGSRIYLRFREFMIVTRVPKAYFVANFFFAATSRDVSWDNKTKKCKRDPRHGFSIKIYNNILIFYRERLKIKRFGDTVSILYENRYMFARLTDCSLHERPILRLISHGRGHYLWNN